MFGFNVRTLQNAIGSPRAVSSPSTKFGASPLSRSSSAVARIESPRPSSSPQVDVGEIDTRAPFESVRAAVSLFGDVVVNPRARPVTKKTRAEEQRLLEKEAQHHMILRELEQYKQRLRALESTKAQAMRDLQQANKTVQELTNKLETLSESKQVLITTTDDAKSRSRELEEKKSEKEQEGNRTWEHDVNAERELYKASSSELIACKQELTNLRQDFDATLDAKVCAFNKEEEARHNSRKNREMKKHLAKEIVTMNETLRQVKFASLQAEDEHLRLVAEKEVHFLVHKSAKEVAEREINRLNEQYDPDDSLERKLDEAYDAVRVVREQLHDIRTADLSSLQQLLSDVDCAKRQLQEAVIEEASIRGYVDSLRKQINEVKRKVSETKTKAEEAEARVQQLETEVSNGIDELDAAMSRNVAEEMQSSLENYKSEAERCRREAEEMTTNAERLRREAEAANEESKQIDRKLVIALKEADEARAAKNRADNFIYDSPSRSKSAVKSQVPARQIRMSIDEFKSMTQKIEDCRKAADKKVAILTSQMHSMSAKEKATMQKMEGALKEKEYIESEIEDASKKAEGAEAARAIVEAELRRCRRGSSISFRDFAV